MEENEGGQRGSKLVRKEKITLKFGLDARSSLTPDSTGIMRIIFSPFRGLKSRARKVSRNHFRKDIRWMLFLTTDYTGVICSLISYCRADREGTRTVRKRRTLLRRFWCLDILTIILHRDSAIELLSCSRRRRGEIEWTKDWTSTALQLHLWWPHKVEH